MIIKYCLLSLTVAFSVGSWALPSRFLYFHYWCGEFVLVEDVSELDVFFLTRLPNYFASARHERADGARVGIVSLNKSSGRAGPRLSIFSSTDVREVSRYDIAPMSGLWHAPMVLGISEAGLAGLNGQRFIAAWFLGGAILLSEDHLRIALCRLPLDENFEMLPRFLERIPQGLKGAVNYLRSCEALLLGLKRVRDPG